MTEDMLSQFEGTLTKKEALQITKELWTRLAKTGSRNKWDWPGWKITGLMRNNCPLCQFDSQFPWDPDGPPCPNCPLFGKWVTESLEGVCEDKGSPYCGWRETKQSYDTEPVNKAVMAKRRWYARQIVSLCVDALTAG